MNYFYNENNENNENNKTNIISKIILIIFCIIIAVASIIYMKSFFKQNESLEKENIIKEEVKIDAKLIVLNNNDISILVGDSYLLTAEVKPIEATNKNIIWNSSDESIAIVSEKGEVIALSTGTAIITAKTENGIVATCRITVVEQSIPAEEIVINQTRTTININDTISLEATIYPINATDQNIVWNSDNESVATVDNNGMVKGNEAGTATIIATTNNGIRETCIVTVEKNTIPVKKVNLNKTSIEIDVKDRIKLTTTIEPSDATNKNIKWSSKDETIAFVNKNGEITGLTPGTTTIMAKSSNGKTATCIVKVNKINIPATSITLDKTNANIVVNDKLKLNYNIYPIDSTDKVINWNSSDGNIVKVDSNGEITGLKTGTANITVTTSNNKTATCIVKVVNKSIAVTNVTLNKTTASINIDKSFQLTPTITPSDATNKDITWSSSDTTIATVNNKGIVTGKKAGKVTITAKTNNGKTATCIVTVKNTTVTNVTLNKTTASINVGKTLQLTATITPSDATNKEVTWSSSDTTIATVNNQGIVTGKKAGKVTITAKSNNGKTATCTVTIKNIAVTGITLDKTTGGINKNDTLQLTATVTPSNATIKTISWSSSDTSVATVSSTGLVTGKKAGKVTITAKSNNGKTATSTIEITDHQVRYAKLDSIVRKKNSDSNTTVEFNASALKYDGIEVALIKGTKVEILDETTNYYKVLIRADGTFYLSDRTGYVLKTSLTKNAVERDSATDRSLTVSDKTSFIRNIINIANATDGYQTTDNIIIRYPTATYITAELGDEYECQKTKTCSNDTKYQEDKTKLRITGYNRILNNNTTFKSVNNKNNIKYYYLSCSFLADVIYDGTYNLNNVNNNGNHYLIGNYLTDAKNNKKYTYSQKQTTAGSKIDMNKMQTGDALIGQTEGTEGHMMLYIGDGIIVHSTSGSTTSKYDSNTSIHFTSLTNEYLTLGSKWKKTLNVIRIKKGLSKDRFNIKYDGSQFIKTSNK